MKILRNPLASLGQIKIKLGLVIVLAVATAFGVNEVGLATSLPGLVRVVMAAALSLLMVGVLTRGMTKPLRQMAAGAQTIARGRYDLRVEATSRDEVGELARAFNAMAADLGEVDRQRRELIANVSHELRTPIAALRAVLENLVDGVSTPDPATLGTALAQAERLGRLVGQLLDLSRLESGVRPVQYADVDLGALCEQAAREATLTPNDVTVRCDVSPGLAVRADPDLLAQVLANLLDNAVRHSPPGGVVTVTGVPTATGVRLAVQDQGPGIPPAERGRVFERFSRLDAGRAADEGGTGLGLAITKEIVQHHNGSIGIGDGPGTTMLIDLPGRITMSDGAPAQADDSGTEAGRPADAAGPARADNAPTAADGTAATASPREADSTATETVTRAEPGSPTASTASTAPPLPPYVPPPLFPRPEVPDAPRWVLPGSALVGVLAAVAVPGSGAGLGVALVAVAAGLVLLPALRRRLTGWSAIFLALAYGLVGVSVTRDTDWLVALMLLAAFLLAALAASGNGQNWLGVTKGGLSVLRGVLHLPWFLEEPVRHVTGRRRLQPVVVGTSIAAFLLLVFGTLFASADPLFSAYLSRIAEATQVAASAPARIVAFVVAGALTAGGALAALRPVVEPTSAPTRRRSHPATWFIPLVTLNLLFAVFIVVQVSAFFGGEEYVRQTAGLTYAEYARSGFFQLAWISVGVLGLVTFVGGRLAFRGPERWMVAGQLGLLCVLTLVVLVSALRRLDLYIDVYGLSSLRACVAAAIFWIAAVFVLVLVAGGLRLTGRDRVRWLPRTLVAVTGVGLLAFGVWNPDLRVAESQVTVRAVDEIDAFYLRDLSADAVPALTRLPEPLRSCVLAGIVDHTGLDRPDPWNAWNPARAHARAILAEQPVDEQATCETTHERLEEY